MRVLVTRPAGDGEATAEKLKALGHDPILAPLIDIQFRDGGEIALDGVQAILATSANGVRAIARRTPRRDVALFAVGRQTAAAARAARFARVRSADGDGANLARAASGWVKPRGGDLLHAAGADTRGDLAATLRENGFTVRTEVLYEARAVAALPAAAAKALGEESVDAVLLFSPRGARIFGELAGKAGLRCAMVTAVCISQQTAAALANVQFRAIEVAARPDQDALLARLDRLGPRL